MINHGIAYRGRRLESVIRLMEYLDSRYTLDFMLLDGDPGYLDELKKLAKRVSCERIRFRPPVGCESIIPAVSEYDISIILYTPHTFNMACALPRKFFEGIMAGNCVFAGVSPDMGRLIKQYDCGVYISDIQIKSIAAILNTLNPAEIDRMKMNSLAAARELNAENESRKFIDIVNKLSSATLPDNHNENRL